MKKFISNTFPILIVCNIFIFYYEWDMGKMKFKEDKIEYFKIKSILCDKISKESKITIVENNPIAEGKKITKYRFSLPYTPKELKKMNIKKNKNVLILNQVIWNKSLKYERVFKKIIINDTTKHDIKSVEKIYGNFIMK